MTTAEETEAQRDSIARVLLFLGLNNIRGLTRRQIAWFLARNPEDPLWPDEPDEVLDEMVTDRGLQGENRDRFRNLMYALRDFLHGGPQARVDTSTEQGKRLNEFRGAAEMPMVDSLRVLSGRLGDLVESGEFERLQEDGKPRYYPGGTPSKEHLQSVINDHQPDADENRDIVHAFPIDAQFRRKGLGAGWVSTYGVREGNTEAEQEAIQLATDLMRTAGEIIHSVQAGDWDEAERFAVAYQGWPRWRTEEPDLREDRYELFLDEAIARLKGARKELDRDGDG